MHLLSNRHWCIVLTNDIDNIDFSQVIEARETLRYSLDRTKFIVKYDGPQPSTLSGYIEYSHSEILTILAGVEWSSPEEL